MALEATSPTLHESARFPLLRYLAGALLFQLAGFVALYYPWPRDSVVARGLIVYLEWLARAATQLIRSFDGSVSVHGTRIDGRFPLEIVLDCSALDIQVLCAAAMIAYPASRLHKLRGVAATVLVLSLLNLARIAALYAIGVHRPDLFLSAHEEGFVLLLVGAAFACFFVWLRRAEPWRA